MANHEGSAWKMEVDGVLEMLQRSENLHDAKYWYYIGDGDTKTFKAILDKQPYGEQIIKKKNVFYMLKKNISQQQRSKEITNTTKKEKAKRCTNSCKNKIEREISVKKRSVNK